MFRGRFLGLVLAALLVFGLLIGGASAIQRDAWTQGYMMGRLSTGTDGGSAVPMMPYAYPGIYGGAGHFGGGLGLIFGIGLLFLLVLVVGRLFGPRAWAMHGGRGCPPWPYLEGQADGSPSRHWHRGPWEWEKQPEASPGETKTAAEPGDAAAAR